MKPWNEKQFKYEQLFESLEKKNLQDNESKEIGRLLLILIALCKDVEMLPENEREGFWNHIKEEDKELEDIVNHYLELNKE